MANVAGYGFTWLVGCVAARHVAGLAYMRGVTRDRRGARSGGLRTPHHTGYDKADAWNGDTEVRR
eukprot:2773229-Prymnesium_polylepis.2